MNKTQLMLGLIVAVVTLVPSGVFAAIPCNDGVYMDRIEDYANEDGFIFAQAVPRETKEYNRDEFSGYTAYQLQIKRSVFGSEARMWVYVERNETVGHFCAGDLEDLGKESIYVIDVRGSLPKIVAVYPVDSDFDKEATEILEKRGFWFVEMDSSHEWLDEPEYKIEALYNKIKEHLFEVKIMLSELMYWKSLK